jgi:hypothetical protein
VFTPRGTLMSLISPRTWGSAVLMMTTWSWGPCLRRRVTTSPQTWWYIVTTSITCVGYLIIDCILVKQIFKQDVVWNVTTLELDLYVRSRAFFMHVFYLRKPRFSFYNLCVCI